MSESKVSVKIGIIGGSGLDDPDIFKNRQEKQVTTPFGNPSDVLILGDIDNVPCVLLARHGRKHSINPGNINYRANIWALKQEGCTHILATTATGSLQEKIHPGDLVIIDNFIDRTNGREQTFHDGQPGHPEGVCHLPMEPAFCEKTRKILIKTAGNLKIPVHESGTVVAIQGPRFSSKAESHMFRLWGGHLINMTTVPEVVLAKEAGICYAATALATDYDCWREGGENVNAADVLKMFEQNVSKITRLIMAVVPEIAKEDWTSTVNELREMVKTNTMIKK